MAINFTNRLSVLRNSTALTRPLFLLGTASALLGSTAAQAFDANSLPQGGTVTGGSATVASSGNTLTVNQSSTRAIIDWRSFDIGANAQANFRQPGTSSIAVNRVNGATDPSRIEGGLHANGQVWILNPNGVLFGKTARVDAAGVVATTANIDDKAFMAGSNRLQMTGGDSGQVVNEGRISVGEGGLAAFVAPSVRNSGTIRARVGRVALAAGDTYTLDLAGDRLVELGLGSSHAVVDQAGKIVNPGGIVNISAKAAGQVVDSVINTSGVTDASSVRSVGGKIVLGADVINVASDASIKADGTSGGQITAVAGKTGNYAGSYSAQGSTGDGGQIETSGKTVAVASGARISASSAHGKAGKWTLDPLDVTVTSGSNNGATTGATVTTGTIEATLAGGTSVEVTTDQTGTDNGDLTLAASINAASTGNAGLTLSGRHLSATGGSTVSIAGGALTLNVNTVNNTATPAGSWIGDALGMIGTVSGGSTVNVGAGTYAESVTLNKADLTLKSTQNATIDANGAALGISVATNAGNLGTLTVDGFTVQNWTSGGIIQGMAAAPFATLHVTNNTVHGPVGGATANGNGIQVSGNGSVVSGNTVLNDHLNSVDWSGSGILAVNGSNITVENNTVNGADVGIGVTNWSSAAGMSGITVSGNTISNAAEAISVQAFEGEYYGVPSGGISGLTITGNTVSDNESGLGVWDYSSDKRGNLQTTLGGVSGNHFTNNDYQISTDFAGGDAASLVSGNTFDRTVINHAATGTVYGDLQTAVDTEAAGSTLDLAGTFGAGTNLNKAGDKLVGHEALINVENGQDGLTISANDVSISGLEIAGPADRSYLTYAWGSNITRGVVVKTGVTDFAITNNDIHGTRNNILVDGHNNTGSITGNTLDNSKSAISVQYTDGAGIDISGNTEGPFGNEWGMNLHLNGHYDALDVYHGNADKIAVNADASTQASLLALSGANGGMTIQDQGYSQSNRTAVTVATTGSDANQGSPLNSLATIGAGIKAVVTGGTINLRDGAYTLAGELDIDKSLTLKGQSQTGTVITSNSTGYGIYVTGDDVSLSTFTYNAPTAVGSTYGIKVEPGTNVASDRVTGFNADHLTINGGYRTALDLNGVDGATIENVSVSGVVHGNGIALTDSANVTISGSTTSNNAWGGLALYQTNSFYDQQVNNISVDGTNSFNDTIPVYAEDQSASNGFGSIALAGFDYVVRSPNDPTDVYSWFQKTQQGAIDFATDASLSNGNINLATASVQGYSGTGVEGDNHFTVGVGTSGAAMSVNVALDQSTTGGIVDVLTGTYAEDVALITPRTVNFDNVTLDNLTVASTGSGSTLSGSVTAGSVTGFDINLGGDLSLDTSDANGTIDLASVNGAHALTLNAGSDGAVLVGSLGGTTRLGAVDITADIIALGATNKAARFDFNGDVVLSEAATVIDTTVSNTAAGNIAFAGDIFGIVDGGQSLTLSAGPGTGARSANGDIAMNNAGISTLRLGSLSVSGDDFSALTVDLKGDFNSTLTGNQVFAADTLNAAGNVSSQVSGNAVGHIVSGGNVTMNAGGNVTGTISGNEVVLTAGQTVSGAITGQTVTLTGQAVSGQVNAKTLNVNAQSGTITGTFTPGKVSSGLSVNGQVTGVATSTNTSGSNNTGSNNTGSNNTGSNNTGSNNTNTGTSQLYVNGQQLVVQNFVLPVGTQVRADGQLVLPAGTVIGLLSPGGGTPRVIMVQSVQELGALLEQGYVAIVIDLTGHKKAVQVASN